ncbi:unnamed protein product [Toxocara canis]|uniref:Ovule protein n=1 Tax=Toxocara canis TaxID=6265 RepID=A0A183VAM6_TOXCA|nr:unnamed protein product [Toxocara canis]
MWVTEMRPLLRVYVYKVGIIRWSYSSREEHSAPLSPVLCPGHQYYHMSNVFYIANGFRILSVVTTLCQHFCNMVTFVSGAETMEILKYSKISSIVISYKAKFKI